MNVNLAKEPKPGAPKLLLGLQSRNLFICHTITWYFYLFATQLHYLKMLKEKKKKCRKRWRGGLKETIELILIRPPQLQFFEDGIKITATGTV